ncbi:MAG TPA: PEP-CTERM sorting domain-containing protein, partial [Bryobacteraceae bacterium]|nr:PEP-CTERM sorting domain-containing protein [Bryobacteraceae bacterium]
NGPFANGGFGGGGGGGYQGGGGGGGYSGGGGGDGSTYGGGGGGSYLDLSVTPLALTAGANGGDGYVTINGTTVPEPGTIVLLIMGLGGLGLIRRRERE